MIAGYNVPLDSDVCRHARLQPWRTQATNVTLADGTANYAGEVSEYCCDSDLAPFDDYVRFDHFGQAVFLVLQVMTIDGWNEVTWPICDANGWAKPMIYTAVVVVIGGFVVLQLFTGHLQGSQGERERRDDRGRGARRRRRRGGCVGDGSRDDAPRRRDEKANR